MTSFGRPLIEWRKRVGNKAWGAVTPNPEFADRAVEKGCRLPTMGNDIHVLRRGVDAFKQAFASQFDS